MTTPTSKGMLLTVTDWFGTTETIFCDHRLLSTYRGKQKSKWVSKSKAKALMRLVPPSEKTTYDKAWDTEIFFGKRSATSRELYWNLEGDGRFFINALVLDFVKAFGRPSEEDDKVLSTAVVLKRHCWGWD